MVSVADKVANEYSYKEGTHTVMCKRFNTAGQMMFFFYFSRYKISKHILYREAENCSAQV